MSQLIWNPPSGDNFTLTNTIIYSFYFSFKLAVVIHLLVKWVEVLVKKVSLANFTNIYPQVHVALKYVV